MCGRAVRIENMVGRVGGDGGCEVLHRLCELARRKGGVALGLQQGAWCGSQDLLGHTLELKDHAERPGESSNAARQGNSGQRKRVEAAAAELKAGLNVGLGGCCAGLMAGLTQGKHAHSGCGACRTSDRQGKREGLALRAAASAAML